MAFSPFSSSFPLSLSFPARAAAAGGPIPLPPANASRSRRTREREWDSRQRRAGGQPTVNPAPKKGKHGERSAYLQHEGGALLHCAVVCSRHSSGRKRRKREGGGGREREKRRERERKNTLILSAMRPTAALRLRLSAAPLSLSSSSSFSLRAGAALLRALRPPPAGSPRRPQATAPAPRSGGGRCARQGGHVGGLVLSLPLPLPLPLSDSALRPPQRLPPSLPLLSLGSERA